VGGAGSSAPDPASSTTVARALDRLAGEGAVTSLDVPAKAILAASTDERRKLLAGAVRKGILFEPQDALALQKRDPGSADAATLAGLSLCLRGGPKDRVEGKRLLERSRATLPDSVAARLAVETIDIATLKVLLPRLPVEEARAVLSPWRHPFDATPTPSPGDENFDSIATRAWMERRYRSQQLLQLDDPASGCDLEKLDPCLALELRVEAVANDGISFADVAYRTEEPARLERLATTVVPLDRTLATRGLEEALRLRVARVGIAAEKWDDVAADIAALSSLGSTFVGTTVPDEAVLHALHSRERCLAALHRPEPVEPRMLADGLAAARTVFAATAKRIEAESQRPRRDVWQPPNEEPQRDVDSVLILALESHADLTPEQFTLESVGLGSPFSGEKPKPIAEPAPALFAEYDRVHGAPEKALKRLSDIRPTIDIVAAAALALTDLGQIDKARSLCAQIDEQPTLLRRFQRESVRQYIESASKR
jgi:hypothetical protein